MTDYISREETLKRLCKDVCNVSDCQCDEIRCEEWFVIHDIPAADVRPVRRGKWENNHCSACGMMPMGEEIWECCDFAPPKFEWFMSFCPNCGADMRGESDV